MQLSIKVLPVESMFAWGMDPEGHGFEQLFLSIEEVENELSILDIRLVVWQTHLTFRYVKVDVLVAIQLHRFRNADILEHEIDRTLFGASVTEFCIFYSQAPLAPIVLV